MVLVVCFIVLVLWYPLVVNKLYPPQKIPAGITNSTVASVNYSNQAGATQGGTNLEVSAITTSTSNSLISMLNTNAPEELVVVTNESAKYTFTLRGGGLS